MVSAGAIFVPPIDLTNRIRPKFVLGCRRKLCAIHEGLQFPLAEGSPLSEADLRCPSTFGVQSQFHSVLPYKTLVSQSVTASRCSLAKGWDKRKEICEHLKKGVHRLLPAPSWTDCFAAYIWETHTDCLGLRVAHVRELLPLSCALVISSMSKADKEEAECLEGVPVQIHLSHAEPSEPFLAGVKRWLTASKKSTVSMQSASNPTKQERACIRQKCLTATVCMEKKISPAGVTVAHCSLV